MITLVGKYFLVNNLENNQKNTQILFYVNECGPPTKADYQHCVIAFAEGLNELNIKFDSNINYYKLNNGEYLFYRKENINPDDYDYVITGYTQKHLPDNVLLNPNRKYKTVMLDWSDGFYTNLSKSKNYDYYFITSYNSYVINQPNVYPMAFNSTNRIIKGCNDNNKLFSNREINLLYSHRINHPIRGYMLNNIYRGDKFITQFNDNFKSPSSDDVNYLNWHQSGRRHNSEFYSLLGNSKIVDCTGGYIKDNAIIYQIDSFKLWEAFFSGCCVIAIDLDLHKIKFPFQPVNMKHYIGFTLNIEKDKIIMDDIKSGKIDIEKIAKEGHEWAKNNYSPKSMGEYILNIINYN